MTSTQSQSIPDPLVPPECDLRDFAFMPLDVARLRDSGLAARASGDEFRAAVLLWCAAWHQVPAGSLPADDGELAHLCGYGRALREWKKIRAGAMHGFILCGDGRWYHPHIAGKALEAWQSRNRYSEKRDQDRERLRQWRDLKRDGNAGETRFTGVSKRDGNAGETRKTGTGTGTGTGTVIVKASAAAAALTARATSPPKTALPEDWLPTQQDLEFVAMQHMADPWPPEKIRSTVDAFRDHYRRTGALSADWSADWRIWVRRQPSIDARRSVPPATAEPASDGFGNPIIRAVADRLGER